MPTKGANARGVGEEAMAVRPREAGARSDTGVLFDDAIDGPGNLRLVRSQGRRETAPARAGRSRRSAEVDPGVLGLPPAPQAEAWSVRSIDCRSIEFCRALAIRADVPEEIRALALLRAEALEQIDLETHRDLATWKDGGAAQQRYLTERRRLHNYKGDTSGDTSGTG